MRRYIIFIFIPRVETRGYQNLIPTGFKNVFVQLYVVTAHGTFLFQTTFPFAPFSFVISYPRTKTRAYSFLMKHYAE